MKGRDHARAGERCALCGAAYAALRVGLTFAEVYRELRTEPERRRVTRRTVLGRMHEHKQNHWHYWHGPGRCAPEDAEPRSIAA